MVGKGSECGNVALCVRYEGCLLSWSWRSIKLLLLHLVGFYITLPTLMVHGQTQIKFDTLWIYCKFSKTLYSELNHFKPSESHLQIELITYGYYKNDKVYLLLWNAEHSQNFNIFPFVFYVFKFSHRKYLRWRYLRDVYAREDGSSRLEKVVNRTAVLTLFFIGIIGLVKWRKMKWQGM